MAINVAGVPVQFKLASARGSKVPVLLRCQHRVPDTSVFEAQPAEVGLTFVDPAGQVDVSDHDRRRPEPFGAQHLTDAKFHATVVLFDQAVSHPDCRAIAVARRSD
jgi:hypothetical protein